MSPFLLSCGDGGTDPSKLIDVIILAGDGQSADLGGTLPLDLVVRSSDPDGKAVANVDLLFSVVQGGGSLSATAVTTNALGTASSTWTVGTQEGTQQVIVSAVANSGTAATFSAEATDLSIEIVFLNHGTPSQDSAFTAAADRWMDILGGELGDVDLSANPVTAGACTPGQPTISDTVDDLRVFVDIKPIDGVGGTLAQAGPCLVRSVSQLPVLGFMTFDSYDVAGLQFAGDLSKVTLHEMAHVLGVGTLWTSIGTLLVNPSLPSNPGDDTHFAGVAAIAALRRCGRHRVHGRSEGPCRESARRRLLRRPLAGIGSRLRTDDPRALARRPQSPERDHHRVLGRPWIHCGQFRSRPVHPALFGSGPSDRLKQESHQSRERHVPRPNPGCGSVR